MKSQIKPFGPYPKVQTREPSKVLNLKSGMFRHMVLKLSWGKKVFG